jgi:L-lactate utilization protein LutB
MGNSGLPAPADLSDDPVELASAARAHLRNRFFSAKVAISGANFLVAETGSLVIVESEGNGRMCLTLPETLISIVGIDKVIPDWQSLEAFLQLLPRSSTGERMNPYTSIFTGVTPGDGPQSFHLVLLDNGRSEALRDPTGRDVLRCIRCSACLNVCPVYERTGGHAYGSPYPGPIGAVLVPQLRRGRRSPLERSLPYASSLCGACYEVCPVKIDIPKILVHLRSEVVDDLRREHPLNPELLAMAAIENTMASPQRFRRALQGTRQGAKIAQRFSLKRLPSPLSGWTDSRDLPLSTEQSFRDWFHSTHPGATAQPRAASSRNQDPKLKSESLVHLLRSGSLQLLRQQLRTWTGSAQIASTTSTENRAPSASDDSSPTTASRNLSDSAARSETLDKIRGALNRSLSDTTTTAHHAAEELRSLSLPPIRRSGALSPEDRKKQLANRLEDYKATVWFTSGHSPLPALIGEISKVRQVTQLVIPADLNHEWISKVDTEIVLDRATLSKEDLEHASATLTACALAISETGTIVLDGGVGQGRRVISLVPDHLIVVVTEDQICELVPEALERLEPTRPQTWISGPSATSDIELVRVEGVHGPRRLDVIIVTS